MTLYVRLGWARTGFEFTENEVSAKNEKNGAVFGVGMRYEMRDWLALRFDYRYVK